MPKDLPLVAGAVVGGMVGGAVSVAVLPLLPSGTVPRVVAAVVLNTLGTWGGIRLARSLSK